MGSAIIYITAVLLANLTATWFVPLPLFGQVAVGTFVFGFTFTQRGAKVSWPRAPLSIA